MNKKSRKKEIEKNLTMYDDASYMGGLLYSKIIKEAKNPVLGVYKAIKQSHQFGLFASIFLRSFAAGWSIPFVPILKNLKIWNKHLYSVLNSWGESLCNKAKIHLNIFQEEPILDGTNYLFVANHLSPYDIPVIYATIPVLAAFISNAEVATLPVFRFWMKQSGSVFIHPENKNSQVKALKEIIKKLQNNINLILFPESTMSRDGKLQEFKRGGLAAATFTNTKILPIYLKGTREVMKPGDIYINQNKPVVIAYGKKLETKDLSRTEKKNINKIVYEMLYNMSQKYDPIYEELTNSNEYIYSV